MAQPATEKATALRLKKRLFSVEEYYRMAEAGILHEDDRVELIEGEVVEMSPIGSRHAACVMRLTNILARLASQDFLLNPQNPVRVGDQTEPEPDLTLLKTREDFYSGAHPRPEDVLVAIEVSDTSLEYDVEVKLPLYARAGIPETWIVNFRTDTIEVHANPSDGGYRETLRTKRGETLRSKSLPALELATDDVLG